MKRADFYQWLERERLAEFLGGTASPCFLFHLPLIQHKVELARAALGERFSIYYAVKANPHPVILETMAALGVGADVASSGELAMAMAAGIPPERMSFSGPGKSHDDLDLALGHGVGAINVESMDELMLLARLAGDRGVRASVGIRINPARRGRGAGLRMAGDTQFGIPEEAAAAALAAIQRHPQALRFAGIHVHVGSQILDIAAIADNIRAILDITIALERDTGVAVPRVNVGGGWGVDYFATQSPLDTAALGKQLRDLLATEPYRELAARAELILEPGRFLVAECGVYATTVLYYKTSRTKIYAIVDGGMHHTYLLAGGMGQVIRRNFEIDIVPSQPGERPSGGAVTLDVAGCLCTPQDLLAVDVTWPHPVQAGDRVLFFNCGAYTWSASPARFLSHREPGFEFVRS